MPDINLLPEQERSAESFENLRRKLLFFSVAVLLVTGVLTLSLLVYFSVLSSTKSKLIAGIEISTQEIETLKPVEELIVVAKGKASSSSEILSARRDMSDYLKEFGALVPQGLYFSDLKVAGGKLSASGRARSSNDVAGLISGLVSARGSKIVSNVNVDSLSSDEGGIYSFSLNMQVVGKEQGL